MSASPIESAEAPVEAFATRDARIARVGPDPVVVAVGFLLAAFAFRLWFCSRLELYGDEAYYWLLSQRLDASYFDKGPGVAWTIALGRALFGDTVFGVRFFAVVLSVATSWWMFLLSRRLFDARVGLWVVLVSSIIPLFAAGGILMTIDPLSVFFWVLAAFAFWVAQSGPRWSPWLLTGVLVGLGALCKYVNLAEILSFAIYLGWRRETRRALFSLRFAVLVLTALLVCVPMVWWNVEHDWVAVRHLLERGAIDRGWRVNPGQLLSFVGQQAGVISPVLFVGIIFAVVRPGPIEADHSAAVRYLRSLFLPLFIGYCLLSLNKTGQPNWTAPAYVAGVILLVARFAPLIRERRGVRIAAIVGGSLALIMTVLLHDLTTLLQLPPRKDPLDRARGSRDLAGMVDAIARETRAKFVIADKYSTTSLLHFYTQPRLRAYQPDTRPHIDNQFSIWPGMEAETVGSNAIFVTEWTAAPASLQRDFESVELIREATTHQDGRSLIHFRFYLCKGLRVQSSSR